MIIAVIILGMIITGLIVLINHISRYCSDDLEVGMFWNLVNHMRCYRNRYDH